MSSVYVIQQQARLRVRNRRLQVERDEEGREPEVLLSVPLGQVSQVVLFGNISLTTPAIDALLAQESEVVFLSAEGAYRGRLVGAVTPHVPLRRAQYRALEKPEFVLQTARALTAAKLGHQRALLLRHNREPQDAVMAAAIAQLDEARQNTARKTCLNSLRGLEGSATAAYFQGFRRLFDPRWRFDDRNRRPPRDPVNVLLSFGYTLLAQAAGSAVQAVGLDPYAGFLHEIAYNRPSLGLDLMEEFRPVVDGVVLWCCRSGQLEPRHFSPGPPERPLVLEDAGRRVFLQAYEQRLDQTFTHPLRGLKLPLRQCLIEQARQLGQRVMDDRPGYTGMGFR